MPVDGVYQNIESILQRIDEIRRRFGATGPGGYGYGGGSFARELEQAREAAGADPARESGSVVNRPPGLSAGENAAVGESGGTAESEGPHDPAIRHASERFGVPEALIRAVIRQESGFDQSAVSPKGAMGLMQLMPGTAALMGVENPFDAVQNILGGTRYLRGLLDLYGGNLNNALAAYNAGPTQVRNRVPDIPETRNFVDAVLENYRRYADEEER